MFKLFKKKKVESQNTNGFFDYQNEINTIMANTIESINDCIKLHNECIKIQEKAIKQLEKEVYTLHELIEKSEGLE